MSYYPSQVPYEITDAWVQSELRRIAEAFEQGSLTIKLLPNSVVPAKETEGEIRIADGTNWNPGIGAGTYIFRGGIWQLIEAGFNKDLRSMSFFLGD